MMAIALILMSLVDGGDDYMVSREEYWSYQPTRKYKIVM